MRSSGRLSVVMRGGLPRVRVVIEVSPDVARDLCQARLDEGRPMARIAEDALRAYFSARPSTRSLNHARHEQGTAGSAREGAKPGG